MDDLESNLESAEMAYGIIARYVEHTQVSGLLIAFLANALGEEKLKPLVQNEHWQMYQASRHQLTEARGEVDRLTALIDRLRELKRGSKA